MSIFVHIGLPKCASTSLQNLWATQKRIRYLGKRNGRRRRYLGWKMEGALREHLVHDSDDIYDAAAIERVFKRQRRKSGLVISDEILSGIGFKSYFRQTQPVATICRRLAGCFGDELILLIVTREPIALLRSYYKLLVMGGYPLRYEQFLEHQLERPDKLLDMLCYEKLRTTLNMSGIAHRIIDLTQLIESPRAFLEGTVDVPDVPLPSDNSSLGDAEFLARWRANNEIARRRGKLIGAEDQQVHQAWLETRVRPCLSDVLPLAPLIEQDVLARIQAS